MSTLAKRVFQSERPGDWVAQIHLEPGWDVSCRYLRHAPNQPAPPATPEIAGRLMGSAANVRGVRLCWIDELRFERQHFALPAVGGQRTVPDPAEWARPVEMPARAEAEYTRRVAP